VAEKHQEEKLSSGDKAKIARLKELTEKTSVTEGDKRAARALAEQLAGLPEAAIYASLADAVEAKPLSNQLNPELNNGFSESEKKGLEEDKKAIEAEKLIVEKTIRTLLKKRIHENDDVHDRQAAHAELLDAVLKHKKHREKFGEFLKDHKKFEEFLSKRENLRDLNVENIDEKVAKAKQYMKQDLLNSDTRREHDNHYNTIAEGEKLLTKEISKDPKKAKEQRKEIEDWNKDKAINTRKSSRILAIDSVETKAPTADKLKKNLIQLNKKISAGNPAVSSSPNKSKDGRAR